MLATSVWMHVSASVIITKLNKAQPINDKGSQYNKKKILDLSNCGLNIEKLLLKAHCVLSFEILH